MTLPNRSVPLAVPAVVMVVVGGILACTVEDVVMVVTDGVYSGEGEN